MSNYELLSIVVESLVRKNAELEKKNAVLEEQVKKSNDEKQNLEFALELQEDINHSLRDDLKKNGIEIADLKEKNAILADQIQKSNQEKENLESESNLHQKINCSLREDVKKADAQVTELINKNADQIRLSNKKEEKLQTRLEKQMNFNDYLRKTLKKKDAELVKSKDPIKAYELARDAFDCYGNPKILEAMVDFCKATGFRGTARELTRPQVMRYWKRGLNGNGEKDSKVSSYGYTLSNSLVYAGPKIDLSKILKIQ